MTIHHCVGSPCAICVSKMGSVTDRTAVLWNGPVCSTCGARFLDSHTCSREDIARKIAELQALLGCPGCGQQVRGPHFCPGPQPERTVRVNFKVTAEDADAIAKAVVRAGKEGRRAAERRRA